MPRNLLSANQDEREHGSTEEVLRPVPCKGRPRNLDVEDRLRRSLIAGVAECGLRGLTIEQVCTVAGVSRSTFYRRWNSLEEALAKTFDSALRVREIADTGDIVADLATFTEGLLAIYGDPKLGPCILHLVAEVGHSPELYQTFRSDWPERRAYNRRRIELAIARQEIDASISPDLIVDILSGFAVSRSMTKGKPVTRAELQLVIRRLVAVK